MLPDRVLGVTCGQGLFYGVFIRSVISYMFYTCTSGLLVIQYYNINHLYFSVDSLAVSVVGVGLQCLHLKLR